MIEWSFLPLAPAWLQLTLIGLLVMTFAYLTRLLYARLQQQSKRRLWSVLVLNFLAFGAIVGLLSNIHLNQLNIKQATLVTSGAKIDASTELSQLDNVFVLSDSRFADFGTNGQGPSEYAQQNWQMIQQPEQMFTQHNNWQQIKVLGDGLNTIQWQSVNALWMAPQSLPSVIYEPAKPLNGLIDMTWARQLTLGQFQTVSGQLQFTEVQDPATMLFELVLLDPAEQVVSRQLVRNNERFQFNFAAKAVGQWIYHLVLTQRNSDSVLSRNAVPFDVQSADLMTILIKQSAPSFETRQLKNWASQFGARITVETQISKDKTLTESVNMDPASGLLGFKALDEYDLLVMDGRALLALSESDVSKLNKAIEKGLGLIILADQQWVTMEKAANLAFLNALQTRPLATDMQPSSTILQWQDYQSEQPVRYLDAEFENQANALLSTLVKGSKGQPIIVSSDVGLGKVAVSLFNSSYQWQTSGLTSLYSHYWQMQFANVARSASPPFWIVQEQDALPTVAQALKICAMIAEPKITNAYYVTPDSQNIPIRLSLEAINADKACTHIWPNLPGWHQLVLKAKDKTEQLSFYVFSSQDWPAWQQQNKQVATQKIAHASHSPTPTEQKTPVPKWPLWCLFIFASTLLWIERKY